MEIQEITIVSSDLFVFEKMLAELSKEEIKGEPKFNQKDGQFKYKALVVATREEAALIRTKLKSIESEILC